MVSIKIKHNASEPFQSPLLVGSPILYNDEVAADFSSCYFRNRLLCEERGSKIILGFALASEFFLVLPCCATNEELSK